MLRPADRRERQRQDRLRRHQPRPAQLLLALHRFAPAARTTRARQRTPATGFLFREGYTFVWSGWDPDAPTRGGGLSMKPIIATNAGAPIVRSIREEFVSGTRDRGEGDGGSRAEGAVFRLTYEAATLDTAAAKLTVRTSEGAPRREIPASGWAFVDERVDPAPARGHASPRPARSTNSITARRTRACSASAWPRRAISFRSCATRKRDAKGTPNPAGPGIRRALAFGSSQSGRFLRDFVRDGFNQDDQRAQGLRRRHGAHRGRRRRLPERGVRAAQPHEHAARGPHVSREARFPSPPRA